MSFRELFIFSSSSSNLMCEIEVEKYKCCFTKLFDLIEQNYYGQYSATPTNGHEFLPSSLFERAMSNPVDIVFVRDSV